MTLVLVSKDHADACARAREAWVSQWQEDCLAEAALRQCKARWERASARCGACQRGSIANDDERK